jgi:hypothetical protein
MGCFISRIRNSSSTLFTYTYYTHTQVQGKHFLERDADQWPDVGDFLDQFIQGSTTQRSKHGSFIFPAREMVHAWRVCRPMERTPGRPLSRTLTVVSITLLQEFSTSSRPSATITLSYRLTSRKFFKWGQFIQTSWQFIIIIYFFSFTLTITYNLRTCAKLVVHRTYYTYKSLK